MPQMALNFSLKLLLPCHPIPILILLTAASVFAVQNNNLRGLYITGQYFYTGESPSEIKGPLSINLIAHDSRGRRVPLTGDVAVSGQGKYRFTYAQLNGDKLIFTTRTIQGISYKFDGKVLKVRSASDSSYEPELEGTLTRVSNGQKSGEVSGRFKYEEFGD